MGSMLPIQPDDGADPETQQPPMPGALRSGVPGREDLLDAKEVAGWLNVTEDWVWDHSTRRAPFLPAIWISEGAVRFRPSAILKFIDERERLSARRRKRR
jgi:predicted DNA-binding transcriptional regulator AlpA